MQVLFQQEIKRLQLQFCFTCFLGGNEGIFLLFLLQRKLFGCNYDSLRKRLFKDGKRWQVWLKKKPPNKKTPKPKKSTLPSSSNLSGMRFQFLSSHIKITVYGAYKNAIQWFLLHVACNHIAHCMRCVCKVMFSQKLQPFSKPEDDIFKHTNF